MIKEPQVNVAVIKVFKEEQVTKGGIYVPDTARKKMNKGEVYAVGDRSDKDALIKLNKGDIVMYMPNAGTEINIGEESFLVIPQGQVFLKLES